MNLQMHWAVAADQSPDPLLVGFVHVVIRVPLPDCWKPAMQESCTTAPNCCDTPVGATELSVFSVGLASQFTITSYNFKCWVLYMQCCNINISLIQSGKNAHLHRLQKYKSKLPVWRSETNTCRLARPSRTAWSLKDRAELEFRHNSQLSLLVLRAGLKYFKYFKIETFHLKYLILKHF